MRAVSRLPVSLKRGIAADQTVIRAAMTKPSSTIRPRGLVTRLKQVRCQMYNRGKLDLPRAGLVALP
jgi:transposase